MVANLRWRPPQDEAVCAGVVDRRIDRDRCVRVVLLRIDVTTLARWKLVPLKFCRRKISRERRGPTLERQGAVRIINGGTLW